MTYCIVCEGLGGRARRALERYAKETGVTLLEERRREERRALDERRVRQAVGRFRPAERRTVHTRDGRRVSDQRAMAVPVTAPRPLPRALRSHADAIRFLEPLEISPQHVEDIQMERLLVQIQAGETRLFQTLYRQWFDRVYTYTRAALERSALAEVATQEIFAELYDALPRHQLDSARFRLWLAGIATRRIQAHLIVLHGPEAVADTRPVAVAGEPHAVPGWVKDVDLQVLVSRLPLGERQVMMLRYLLGLSQTEVADVLERSCDAVGDLHASGLSQVAERQLAIGQPSEAPGVRFAMARRRRSARVLQSRRFALTPG